MKRNKMTKDVIPEDFTLALALVDALPVLFFGASMIVAGLLFRSGLFLFGAALCLFAGAAKVLWKIIVVLKRKNIWWLFLQMRTLMPVGFLLMIVGVIGSRGAVDIGAIARAAMQMPPVLFFGAGIVGMGLMMAFAFTLDSSDVRSNWIEQLTNGAAQLCFFVGLVLVAVDFL